MPNSRSVSNCLRDLGSCSEEIKERLRYAGLVEGNELTPLGHRLLTETYTMEDAKEMQSKIDSWYCYGHSRAAAKSPIDCGDR